MSEHVCTSADHLMLVDERRKLLIFMNVSFGSINRAHLVHRRPAVQAYRDRGELATNKSATPFRRG